MRRTGLVVRRLPRSKLARREALEGFAFILPWILGFLLLRVGPLTASLLMSFTRYTRMRTFEWVGLQNYAYMFTQDPRFRDSLRATALFTGGNLPLGLALGLGIALLMNRKVPGITLFRTIYYLPAVISGVAVAILWQFVFHKQYGVLNAILALVGIRRIGWLIDPQWVMVAFIIMSLWGVGGGMIIYLAGLQSIPTDLYEAASIDGANRVQQFWSVTLPMLSPTIFFNLVTGLIGTLQSFENAYIMTMGGPNYATYFFGLNIYQTAFRSLNFGYASALAWFLFVAIAGMTVLLFRTSKRWVYYAGERV